MMDRMCLFIVAAATTIATSAAGQSSDSFSANYLLDACNTNPHKE